MTIATIPTLLSLNQYADIMGYDPRHFNQMVCTVFPERSGKSSVWYQHLWQDSGGKATRESLSSSIAQAEEEVMQHLGYFIGPSYTEPEECYYPNPRFNSTPYEKYIYRPKITLNNRFIIELGRKSMSVIEEDVDISSSRLDRDGDGWEELVYFTITVADTSVIDINDIAVFPHGSTELDETEMIRPLKIKVVDDTTISIEGQSAWFVDQNLFQKDSFIDGDDEGVYLDTVDIYEIQTISNGDNPSVVFKWETYSVPEGYTEHDGVGNIVNKEHGRVTVAPATWDSDTETWSLDCDYGINGNPNYMDVYYRSGIPLKNGRVASPYDRAIAMLATAKMPHRVDQGGASIDKFVSHWQEVPDARELRAYGFSCPFGPKRGAWEAYRLLQRVAAIDMTMI